MEKLKFFSFALIFIFLFVSCSTRERLDTIIKKNIELRGDSEDLHDIKTLFLQLKITTMGLEFPPTKIYLSLPNQFRSEITYNEQNVVTIINNDKAYTIENGYVKELDDNTISEIIGNIQSLLRIFQSELSFFEKEGGKIQQNQIISEKFNGRLSYRIPFNFPNGETRYVYVDSKTYLNSGLVLKNSTDDFTTGEDTRIIYSDYHRIGNFLVPFELSVFKGNSLLGVQKIDSLALNIPLDPKLFNP